MSSKFKSIFFECVNSFIRLRNFDSIVDDYYNGLREKGACKYPKFIALAIILAAKFLIRLLHFGMRVCELVLEPMVKVQSLFH